MNCKSCNHTLTNNAIYCSHCGGKVVNDRLSIKGTWNEFIGPFFGWDHTFWRTFKTLFTNPKDVLNAYISGARKKYFQPFGYLVLYVTILVIFYKIIPLQEQIEKLSIPIYNSSDPVFIKITTAYYNAISNYINFFIIAMIPFFSLLTYLTFRKRGNNFSEHLVFNSYIQANYGYLGILILIFDSIFNLPKLSFSISYVVFTIYAIYVFRSFYSLNVKETIFSFFRYIMYIILISIVFFLGLVVLGIIIGFLYKMSS